MCCVKLGCNPDRRVVMTNDVMYVISFIRPFLETPVAAGPFDLVFHHVFTYFEWHCDDSFRNLCSLITLGYYPN